VDQRQCDVFSPSVSVFPAVWGTHSSPHFVTHSTRLQERGQLLGAVTNFEMRHDQFFPHFSIPITVHNNHLMILRICFIKFYYKIRQLHGPA
jgi:hypothetical protein